MDPMFTELNNIPYYSTFDVECDILVYYYIKPDGVWSQTTCVIDIDKEYYIYKTKSYLKTEYNPYLNYNSSNLLNLVKPIEVYKSTNEEVPHCMVRTGRRITESLMDVGNLNNIYDNINLESITSYIRQGGNAKSNHNVYQYGNVQLGLLGPIGDLLLDTLLHDIKTGSIYTKFDFMYPRYSKNTRHYDVTFFEFNGTGLSYLRLTPTWSFDNQYEYFVMNFIETGVRKQFAFHFQYDYDKVVLNNKGNNITLLDILTRHRKVSGELAKYFNKAVITPISPIAESKLQSEGFRKKIVELRDKFINTSIYDSSQRPKEVDINFSYKELKDRYK